MMHAVGYVVAGTERQSSSIDVQVLAISGLRMVLWMGGVVAACPVPIFITFSSVCEQIKDMPVGFALWEQVLGAV